MPPSLGVTVYIGVTHRRILVCFFVIHGFVVIAQKRKKKRAYSGGRHVDPTSDLRPASPISTGGPTS